MSILKNIQVIWSFVSNKILFELNTDNFVVLRLSLGAKLFRMDRQPADSYAYLFMRR